MGAGAIGSLFGGYLAKLGEDVTLIGRPLHVEAINEKGLKIDGVNGEHQINVKAVDDIKYLDPANLDLILVTVKAYDVENAVNDIKPLISPKTNVLFLQNGLGIIDLILKIINQDQIIRGTTTNGALFIQPGYIRHTGQGDTFIGKLNSEKNDILNKIKSIFDRSGLPTKITTSIKEILWRKLLINISINAFGALTGLPNGELKKFFEDSMKQVIQEAIKIAKKMGIEIDINTAINQTFNVLEKTAKNRNSMLQDVERKKKTEIDFINGIIVKYGKIQGIPTPLNSLITSFIKGLEKSYLW